MKVKQLQDGFKGSIRVLLLNVSRGVTNKGAPYLSFQIQDASGSLDAKYWNVSPELLTSLKSGMIVDIYGDVIIHQKQLQFRVNKAQVVEENIDIYEYVPEGPIPQQQLKTEIQTYVQEIENKVIRDIMDKVMEEFGEKFYNYPAAMKNHHDFVGGLATHVLGMLHLGESICKQYPHLNKDLIVAGIVLHDVGKVIELSGAIVTEYTMVGKLLGHISIMQAELHRIAADLGYQNCEEVILLRHMVLSHHGVYEYGSPVLPMIPEAEVLYLIDNLDARMNAMKKALEPIEEGDFSSRVFSLENRMIYKSTIK